MPIRLTIILAVIVSGATTFAADTSRPNFIIILCDNLGYGDIGCFGSTIHRTPNIDRMAREGLKLTSFYSTSGVCTPSRASLMTACYPRRVSMHETQGAVLRPVSPIGLNPDETTIAEVLKTRGYATALIGKWHLGDQAPFLPTRQGFDFYFGIPYSDDMTPRKGKPWPPLPLFRNETVIDAPVDRDLLTKRYTQQTIDVVTTNKDKPFFLILSHAMPGSTRAPYASEAFRGKSKNGRWGDSVEEIDWSTGEILAVLKKLDLDTNTLVIWTSDNGAPRRNPPQGLNRPLKGWGYTTAEGGMRVPCIARWPGRIQESTSTDEVATMMDFLPTFAAMSGAKLPTAKIDGRDIRPLLFDRDAKSPYEAFYYYHMSQLQAVRVGKWKLYLSLKNKRSNLGSATRASAAELYDLREDLGEARNVASTNPEVVERLRKLAKLVVEDLGDHGKPGTGQRKAGRSKDPVPQLLRKK